MKLVRKIVVVVLRMVIRGEKRLAISSSMALGPLDATGLKSSYDCAIGTLIESIQKGMEAWR